LEKMDVEQRKAKRRSRGTTTTTAAKGKKEDEKDSRKQLCVSLDDRERGVFQRALLSDVILDGDDDEAEDMFGGSLISPAIETPTTTTAEQISQLTAMMNVIRDERDANASYNTIARQACGVLGAICARIATVSDVQEAEDDMVKNLQQTLNGFSLATDDYGEGIGERESASIGKAIETAERFFTGFMDSVVPLAVKSVELQTGLDHMTQRYEERGEKLKEGSASFQKMNEQYERLVEYSKETEALNHALEEKMARDKMVTDEQFKMQNDYFNIIYDRNTQIAKNLHTKHEECVLATSVCDTLTMENIRLREMVDTLEHRLSDVTRKLAEWSHSQRLPTPEDVKNMRERKLVKRAYAVLSAKHEVTELELVQAQHAFQAEAKSMENQLRDKELQLLEAHQQRLAEVERRESKINSDRASLGEERRTLAAKVDSMCSEIDILKKDKLRLETEASAAAASVPPPCAHNAEELLCADITLQLVGYMCRGAHSSSSAAAAVEPAKKLSALFSVLSQKRANNELQRRQHQDTKEDYKAVYACLRENMTALSDYAKRVRPPSVSATRKDSDGMVVLGKLCVDLVPFMLNLLKGCCKGEWRAGVEHEWIRQQLPKAEALCTSIVAAYKTESVTLADATQLRTCMMQELPSSKDPPDAKPCRRHRLMQWLSFHAASCMDMNDHFAVIEKNKTAKALEHMQTLNSKLFESTTKRINELVGALTSGAFPLFTKDGESMMREMDEDLKTLDARVSLIVAEALVPLDIKHVITSYQSAWKFMVALVESLRQDPKLNPPPPSVGASSSSGVPLSPTFGSSPIWDPTKK
jgi:hypothetical protein